MVAVAVEAAVDATAVAAAKPWRESDGSAGEAVERAVDATMVVVLGWMVRLAKGARKARCCRWTTFSAVAAKSFSRR